MDIRSTAMDITLEGYHTFSNEFDYYIEFNLRQVLSKKPLKTNEFGFIEDNELGERMIYLHAYTLNGDIEVDVDKFGSKKRGERKLKVGKGLKKVKDKIQQELDIFNQDTLSTNSSDSATFNYELDLSEFEANDSTKSDSALNLKDSVKFKLFKKKKKVEKEQFEEFEFEDDDY